MNKKKTRKSRAARMKDLPAKKVNTKTAKGVKGGEGPAESISFNYGKIEYKN